MGVRPDDKVSSSRRIHTQRNTHAYRTYIHTAHKRLPLKHALVKLDEVPLSISKPTWKCRLAITDATRTSRKWKPQEQKCEAYKPFSNHSLQLSSEETKRGIFWFVLKPKHLIILFSQKRTVLPCWIQHFCPCQILITQLSWKPDTAEGGGKKIQLTSMNRSSTWGIFIVRKK